VCWFTSSCTVGGLTMICDFAKIYCCICIRLLTAEFQILLSKHLVAIFDILL